MEVQKGTTEVGGGDNVLTNRRAHIQVANNWRGRALTWDFMVNNSHNLKMRYKNCDIVTDQNNKTEGIQSSNRQCCAYFELPPTLLEATFSLLRELYSRTEEII